MSELITRTAHLRESEACGIDPNPVAPLFFDQIFQRANIYSRWGDDMKIGVVFFDKAPKKVHCIGHSSCRCCSWERRGRLEKGRGVAAVRCGNLTAISNQQISTNINRVLTPSRGTDERKRTGYDSLKFSKLLYPKIHNAKRHAFISILTRACTY